MHPLEKYILDLRDIRSTGEAVPETSYYGVLASLLNEVGKSLKTRVRCIINPRNRGAGIPDGGLFTPDQFQRHDKSEPIGGQIPARGVIEIKPTGDDAFVTSEGKQVSRYWDRYGQVLVSNYRDFVMVGTDRRGRSTKLETYRLAETEDDFWEAVQHPRRFVDAHGVAELPRARVARPSAHTGRSKRSHEHCPPHRRYSAARARARRELLSNQAVHLHLARWVSSVK